MNTHSFQIKWAGLFFAFIAIWLFFGKVNGEADAFGVTTLVLELIRKI